MTPSLSIVIPVFNEEGNIAPLLAELDPVLDRVAPDAEVVLVNDGSTDGTHAAILRELPGHPRVRYLRLRANTGQTGAFDAGFRAARAEWIATMDGDLQIDPADLGALLAARDAAGVDFVFGRRAKRKDGFVKTVSTKIANGVRNRLTGETIVDTGCPLKVFRRAVADRIPLFTGFHRFFITLAHLEGFTSTEVVVSHRPRLAGTSKYGVWNRVFRALRDCLVVRWMQARRFRYAVDEIGADDRVAASTSKGFRDSPALDRPLRDGSTRP